MKDVALTSTAGELQFESTDTMILGLIANLQPEDRFNLKKCSLTFRRVASKISVVWKNILRVSGTTSNHTRSKFSSGTTELRPGANCARPRFKLERNGNSNCYRACQRRSSPIFTGAPRMGNELKNTSASPVLGISCCRRLKVGHKTLANLQPPSRSEAEFSMPHWLNPTSSYDSVRCKPSGCHKVTWAPKVRTAQHQKEKNNLASLSVQASNFQSPVLKGKLHIISYNHI